MKKFVDCNVVEILQDIMRHNTEHYQSDFDYDRSAIVQAAYSPYPNEKNLIWICRRNGTHCFFEREVYVRETHAHHASLYMSKPSTDPVIAYAIELKHVENGCVMGDLYELDLYDLNKSVKEKSLEAYKVILAHSDGINTLDYEDGWVAKIPQNRGLQRAIILPADLKLLDQTIKDIQEKRRNDQYYSKWDYTKLQNYFTIHQKSEIEM